MYDNPDLAPLQAAYGFAAWVCGVVHVATLLFVGASRTLTLARVFGLKSPFEADWGWAATGFGEQLFDFLRWDLAVFAAAAAVYCVFSVYEMRRNGWITTATAFKVWLAIPWVNLLVGPGAAYALLWSWREGTIAGLSIKG
jgi:hypothetical protein